MSYKIVFTRQAVKDSKKIDKSGLKEKARNILFILSKDPYQKHPSYENLVGDLKGLYSRRISIQHRIVYQVFDDLKIVKVIRMWTHYE